MSRPRLHVIYRFSAAPNGKRRPSYFTQDLALTSFARAIEQIRADVQVTFLVDGHLPGSSAELMRTLGEVVVGDWGSNRASYLAQVRLMATSVTADLVWFAEDDYLYQPRAFGSLLAAADAAPEAAWFALSGPTRTGLLEARVAQGPVAYAPLSRPGGVVDVDGIGWRRIDSTTSSFGARTATARSQRLLLRLCPGSGAAWDRTTCLAVQGLTPYPWRYILSDLLVPSTPTRHRSSRIAWRLGSRLLVNVVAMALRRRGQSLIAPEAALIGHMDLPLEDDPATWAAVATDTLAWSAQRYGRAVDPAEDQREAWASED